MIKRCLLIGMLLLSVFPLYAETYDSIKIEKWLKEAFVLPDDSCRVLHYAKQMLGVPYVAGTLDGHDEEQLVVRVDALDCTTFVETVLAFCIVDKRGKCDYESFKEALTQIRYRDGILNGYASRLHYFSDWIRNNEDKGLVKECTCETPCHRSSVLWLDFMTTHVDSYVPMKNNPCLVNEIAYYEKNWQGAMISYIPKENLNLSPGKLSIKNGDILAITTNMKGLDVVHVGFACWHGKKLHLLHASSNVNQVILDDQTLYEYSKNKKLHTGVRVIRFVY